MTPPGPTSWRQGWRLAGALALAGCLTTTAAAQIDPRLPRRVDDAQEALARLAVNPYLAIVSKYRAGNTADAIAEIRRWPHDDVTRAHANIVLLYRRLSLPPAPPQLLDVADVEASVILHTDAAFAALTDGADEESHFHLNSARNLLTFLVAAIENSAGNARSLLSRRDVIGRRDWYFTVITVLQGFMRIDEADRLASAPCRTPSSRCVGALQLFPNDGEIHLAAGSIKEQLAAEHFREVGLLFRPGRTQANEYMRERAVAQERRNTARTLYERALTLNPALVEAHIRLAHVLMRDNLLDTAQAHLDAALRTANQPRLRYLTHLFIGAIHEREKRVGDAVVSYRRSMEIDANAQSARVALAHALEMSGALDEARTVLAPPLKPVGPRRFEEDGWWMYPRGQYLAGTAMLDRFRERVQQRE